MRFRRARGTERQQLRWVAMAAGLLAAAAVVATIIGALTDHPAVLEWTSGLFVALLPVAIGAAVLRYRLYDLDRIISRTLAWTLLTLLLGLGYTVVVLGLGRLLPQGSSLGVAAATLAVAAVFQPPSPPRPGPGRPALQPPPPRRRPYHRRLQQPAPRAGRLNTLTTELLAVVDQTMQPTRSSLWLRPHAQQSAHPTH
jgi:peptidoglycan/LPS O-acetylase OafA/YrhL